MPTTPTTQMTDSGPLARAAREAGGGRPVAELTRLQRRFEELAEQVLSGEVDRAKGTVACQLLNGVRACVRDALAAREQEELIERLEALEDAAGGGGGCDRCCGMLVSVYDAITGRLDSAEWNGEEITEEELREREAEPECPRCGRKIDPDEEVEIRVGGEDGI